MSKKTKTGAPTMSIDAAVTAPEAPKDKSQTISLAKANKLRNSIDSFLSEVRDQITQKANGTVTGFPGETLEAIKAKIEVKKNEISVLARDYGILSSIRASLKTQIGILNASVGIGETMANIERLERIIETFGSIYENRRYTTGVSVFDEETVNYTIARNIALAETENRSTVATANPSTFSVNLYTKADIDGEVVGLRNLRKAKAELEEKRNALNYSSTINLDGSVVEFLEARSLI